jgi:ribosomal protein L44E
MPVFRLHNPARRAITTAVNSHRDHKPNLKIDFQSRCGYCNSLDEWKTTYYEVDHFIPVSILTILRPTDYCNLVYACRSCNNAKRKKWPTNDENIPNLNNEGFVDPCDVAYVSHFTRRDDGEIGYLTDLGKWMYFAMNLHKPQHKIIWNLEQLRELITELENLNTVLNNHPLLQAALLTVYRKFVSYSDQLRAI